MPRLIPQLKSVLFKLDLMEGAREKVRRGIRVLKSFANAAKVSYGDFQAGFDFDAEIGTADSGNLDNDLAELLLAVGEAAMERHTAVALIIDEIQYISESELSAMIAGVHRINQKSLPIVLVGAGLPQVLAKMGNAKSYAERLFDFPQVSALLVDDATKAIVDPAKALGVSFEGAAVEEILRITQRYAYFLQEWAYVSWNLSENNRITYGDVIGAHEEATKRLDQSFFRMRLERTSKVEKRYMRAMAELGPGPNRSGEIAAEYGAKVTTLAPARSSLIAKGMIYSPSYGDTEFTVPMFDEFMRREMPK